MPYSFLLPAYDASIATIPPTQLFTDAVVLRDLKGQLRSAHVLLTCSTTGLLDVVPYPCDTQGAAVPVSELPAYNRTHAFTDAIHCFCGVVSGTPRTVRIFTSRSQHSDHFGCVCIGCADWRPSGDGAPSQGCSYFVNLVHRFSSGSLTADQTPLRAYPFRTAVPVTSPTPVRPLLAAPTPTAPFGLPPRAAITPPPPRLLSPLGLVPGFLCDADRLWSPIPPELAFRPVEDRSVWPDPVEAEQTILSLIDPTNPGTSYTKLVCSLGNCILCGRVMALHLILSHYCLPLPEERASAGRKGDKIYGMDLPFAIGLPTPSGSSDGGAGSSVVATRATSVDGVGAGGSTSVEPCAGGGGGGRSSDVDAGISLGTDAPATPIKLENADESDVDAIILRPRRPPQRVLIPADRNRLRNWLDEYWDQLQSLKPDLPNDIWLGKPLPGPLFITGRNQLYIGQSSVPRKRKSEVRQPEPEDVDGSSGEELSDSVREKGKGVKRSRRLGEVFGEGGAQGMGSGGSADGAGDGGSVGGLGAVTVKMEDVAEHRLREEPFTTKDGKQVTLIDLTDN